jgi:hypothetical protein
LNLISSTPIWHANLTTLLFYSSLSLAGLSQTFVIKSPEGTGHWWLTPVILAIQEAEIRKIAVRSQPGQIVL